MNILQSALQFLILQSLPSAMINDTVYDFLVVHDNPDVKDVTSVTYKKKKYGLIHRDAWNVLKRDTAIEIAALDNPELAEILLKEVPSTEKETCVTLWRRS